MELHSNDIGTLQDRVTVNIEIAYENLSDAITLLNNNRLRSSASRTYYSMFKAISAIKALDGIEFRKHKDALGQFNKKYINENVFPRSYSKHIYQIMQSRHMLDYESETPSKEDLQEYVSFTKHFCNDIKQYCEQKLSKEITVEKLPSFDTVITDKNALDSLSINFINAYNKSFMKKHSHDEACIDATISMIIAGENISILMNTIEKLAPKSYTDELYSLNVIHAAKEDPHVKNFLSNAEGMQNTGITR